MITRTALIESADAAGLPLLPWQAAAALRILNGPGPGRIVVVVAYSHDEADAALADYGLTSRMRGVVVISTDRPEDRLRGITLGPDDLVEFVAGAGRGRHFGLVLAELRRCGWEGEA